MASPASFNLSTHFITPNLTPPPQEQSGCSFRARQPLRVSATSTSVQSPISCTATPRISPEPSLYDVLGIQMGATFQEIKAAYRRLARSVHPDVAACDYPQEHASSDEFMRVHAAYATLSDPEKRANYDRILFRGRRTMSTRVISSATGYSGYPARRTWETDQCW